jgi:Sec1 family
VRIARDCAQNLYGSFHINVVTRLERPLMEEFAKLVVQTGSLHHIASIHDQYLDYVVLERNLFSLAIPDSYQLYNGAATTDAQMEAAMGDVALGLFSVVASLGHVPIIRCPKVCTRERAGYVCACTRAYCVVVTDGLDGWMDLTSPGSSVYLGAGPSLTLSFFSPTWTTVKTRAGRGARNGRTEAAQARGGAPHPPSRGRKCRR